MVPEHPGYSLVAPSTDGPEQRLTVKPEYWPGAVTGTGPFQEWFPGLLRTAWKLPPQNMYKYLNINPKMKFKRKTSAPADQGMSIVFRVSCWGVTTVISLEIPPASTFNGLRKALTPQNETQIAGITKHRFKAGRKCYATCVTIGNKVKMGINC